MVVKFLDFPSSGTCHFFFGQIGIKIDLKTVNFICTCLNTEGHLCDFEPIC